MCTLALHVFFRPVNEDDPVQRDDILSLRKLLAAGGLEEMKMILGWFIKPADDKAARWSLDLDDIIVSVKELESIIGKLNTTS